MSLHRVSGNKTSSSPLSPSQVRVFLAPNSPILVLSCLTAVVQSLSNLRNADFEKQVRRNGFLLCRFRAAFRTCL